MPLPEVNRWLDMGDGEPMIKADFLWREQRVIVETDGDKFMARTRRASAIPAGTSVRCSRAGDRSGPPGAGLQQAA